MQRATPTASPGKSLSGYFLHPVTLYLIGTCIKLLLLPSYKSTDFDVHRNWLALTRHVPIHQWYTDDFQGRTRHTLDYPPLFAWFEFFLVHNPLTTKLLEEKTWLSERCLTQLPDSDNNVDFYTCVLFHRLTVIFVGDLLFWMGSWFFVSSLSSISTSYSTNQAFAFIVLNPGILLLDHIHFQYNGMLLGILLASLACLIRGQMSVCKHVTSPGKRPSRIRYLLWDVVGAILFTILLSLKHLYLILAPFYFTYLLRHFCFLPQLHVDETQQQPRRSHKWSFDGGRFLLLASVTLFTILLPLWPFLIHSSNDSSNTTLYWPLGEGSYFSLEQVKYMIQRLFPFERGLCHTYWAGNIWSLYLFTNKVLTWIQSPSVTRRLYQPTWISLQSWFPWIHSSFHLPVISPSTCAFCLILSLVPGLICAWNVATVSLSLERYSVDESTNDQHGKRHGISNINVFLEGVLYSSYCGFMFSYHVHEKAIMTCILPMTLLAFTSNNACVRHRFFRMCVYGHFGLLPLLFESMETTLKLVLYFVYLVWLVHELNIHRTLGNMFAVMSTSVTLVYTDVIHPIVCKGSNSYSRWEFLPLLLTSLVCAMGLTYGWIESFGALRQELAGISNQKRKVIM